MRLMRLRLRFYAHVHSCVKHYTNIELQHVMLQTCERIIARLVCNNLDIAHKNRINHVIECALFGACVCVRTYMRLCSTFPHAHGSGVLPRSRINIAPHNIITSSSLRSIAQLFSPAAYRYSCVLVCMLACCLMDITDSHAVSRRDDVLVIETAQKKVSPYDACAIDSRIY